MILYHGSRDDIAPHIGLCLTDEEISARHYGRQVAAVEIDLSDLIIVTVTDYDRDTNTAAGDADIETYDADIICYEDEDPYNRAHDTWRIVSDRALAALRVITTDIEMDAAS